MAAGAESEVCHVLHDQHIDLDNANAMTKSIIRHPKSRAVSTLLVTLLAGAVSIVACGFWRTCLGVRRFGLLSAACDIPIPS